MKVNLSGMVIHFDAFGRGEPVVLLHGWQGNRQVWQGLLPYLSPFPYQFISLDLPGFGESDPFPFPTSSRDFAQKLHEFANELELKNLTLLGHSLGGKIALFYAAAFPLQKLILVDSAGIRRRSLVTEGILRLAKHLKPRFPLKNSLASLFRSSDYEQAGTMRPTLARLVEEDVRPLLPQIKAPTLLLWGGEDKETPLRDAVIIQRAIKNSQLRIIPEAGHFPFLDQPALVAQLIGEFLAQ
jgi:pimeloyl-ACP methyl ester carboxylesterase